ncbi:MULTISPECIES: nicotinate-nucleotide--dimethylbenzimidazole phosphoribosyltransferase [Actibacterium]|uniref:Nicotinate-nucleotide--dimethylbenzimidazole phosphoribosyltransferase n=1 Tax=Actibacterium naphthalenivorans TaxID=1614693 RepID=A0A840CHD8_9RHOB|nr:MULTISPECIES: nicotinate-nucleotide--dimethylbenzimidazole phosphoribosyltransferase [Actibacterium]ALG91461.1 nicotinate-nucleotide--dimethylbenzimidazole phosphoribosyltransferase [Actibacterium sp. EMB200-NS6]MBB4022898.1 nicotinate-nucleotide--dimethylbenzimidazole phosphoribosyltransferase [Actibacterium naphthalenivorans]
MSNMPFELSALADLISLPARLPQGDPQAAEAARARQNALTKPPGSLGRLEALATFMAAWHGTDRPVINKAQALVFAGNHGICAQGVNPYPQDVTAQMVANFEAGGAAINQLCRANGADLSVVALDLDRPTGDFTEGPAMSEAETLAAMNRGAAAVDPGADVLILGEMGIGNSTIAAALAAAIFGGDVARWVGPGTGADAEGLKRKVDVIERGLARHDGLKGNAPALLAALGGREQAAICGAVLAARAACIPVILDGFICTAAVAPLHGASPALLDHCLAGHVSAEPGHRLLLEAMGKEPVLSFDMRLGEGSGAALALGILRAALECHNGMATFGEAGVSEA